MLIYNKFGVEVDTNNVSLEELQALRNDVADLLNKLKYEVTMRKVASHKHASSEDTTTPAKV